MCQTVTAKPVFVSASEERSSRRPDFDINCARASRRKVWNKKGKKTFLRMNSVLLAGDAEVGPGFENICVSACRLR